MSRMLTSSVVLAVWSFLVWDGQPAAFAQGPPGNVEVRQPRPQPVPLQVQKLPPELEKLLLAWSQNSAQVQKLQGRHLRHVYDTVFNVEKRSRGVFYYEGPGKGRIDLTPAPIQNGEVSKKTDPMGEPFKLQADRPERWICDGKDIWQVNDTQKQIDIFPIPEENQGQNIMDGPMPFLFGMPPAKAKMRYFLKLISEDKDRAWIEVLPRLRVDAANWKKAQVILDKTLWLPTAVKLIDPSGNLETVYQFGEFQVNTKDPNWLQIAFGAEKDPFRPELKGYARSIHTGQELPSVVGLGWENAKALLEKLGCRVEIFTGEKAPAGKFTHVVYEQKPPAKSPLAQGQQIVLTIYAPAAAPAPVPAVLGLHWKDAGEKLKAEGYKVTYLPGQVAPTDDHLYTVYQQVPKAGEPLKPGEEVKLTVYNKAK